MAFDPSVSCEQLRAAAHAFAQVRDWEQFHTTRNLLLAVVSEVGELADLVRWAGDQEPCPKPEDQQAWADEIADVAILLFRLADVSGVNLPRAFLEKLAKAGEKYPVDTFKGSNRKAGR